MTTVAEDRISAIHLLRSGLTVRAVAAQLGYSEPWVRKWQHRYAAAGWAGLVEHSRAPHRVPHQLPGAVRQAIILVRSQLEVEAATGGGLKYIGACAVRTRLQAQGCTPLPSIATIERVLQAAALTKPRQPPAAAAVVYPHLTPTGPHEWVQVDIVPHYLLGGARIYCFNALDVVSRYAVGHAYAERRAADALTFALAVWQAIGIPRYTQFDNDGCFSGGHTHAYVLGKLVRLALAVGTEVVFSPVRHPESNGYVERFHQEYNRHVWQDLYLPDLATVNTQGERFFQHYNDSGHQRALHGQAPATLHATPPYRLAADQHLPQPLPLYAGRIHFIRRVRSDGMVSVLNVDWAVPQPDPQTGVWVTLELQPAGATLTIYDAAPDVPTRRRLAHYPFPVEEPILPRTAAVSGRPAPAAVVPATMPTSHPVAPHPPFPLAPAFATMHALGRQVVAAFRSFY